MKKTKPPIIKTDPFSIHEAMDRCYTIEAQIDAYLVKHEFIENRPEFKNKAIRAAEILADLYQEIGQFI